MTGTLPGPGTGTSPGDAPVPEVPHSARVYDALLGGSSHYPVDRAVADALPDGAAEAARQNRAFMRRAVAWLAARGTDQFLDLGSGIPTEPNLHRVAQSVRPGARVVYTDNDPVVLRHSTALLADAPEGTVHYLRADVREPEELLERARTLLDFTRPVAVSLIGLLHFLPDGDGDAASHAAGPGAIVATLVRALCPGSHLALTQGASDLVRDFADRGRAAYEQGGIALALRSREEFARFLDGLEPVGPGIVTAPEWAPAGAAGEGAAPGSPAATGTVALYAAVARVR